MALPAFGELFKSAAPLAHGGTQFWQRVAEFCIARVFLEPRFKSLRLISMCRQRLLGGLASRCRLLLLLRPS